VLPLHFARFQMLPSCFAFFPKQSKSDVKINYGETLELDTSSAQSICGE
jgi:hypothetical protein